MVALHPHPVISKPIIVRRQTHPSSESHAIESWQSSWANTVFQAVTIVNVLRAWFWQLQRNLHQRRQKHCNCAGIEKRIFTGYPAWYEWTKVRVLRLWLIRNYDRWFGWGFARCALGSFSSKWWLMINESALTKWPLKIRLRLFGHQSLLAFNVFLSYLAPKVVCLQIRWLSYS